jgi:GR25 family glycosyltransferase involved in LPS biosynthesis
MSNIPVYIINLKQDTQRLSDTLRECREQKLINITRIDAVNGKELDDSEIQKVATFIGRNTATKSIIGCAMSHIKTWETILENNNNIALIFEDDISLCNNFVDQLKSKLEAIPNDFDMLYIGCEVGCDVNNKSNMDMTVTRMLLGKGYNFEIINSEIYVPRFPLAFHAYIVSKKGVHKLLKLAKDKIYTHIDAQVLMNGKDYGIITYASEPLLAFQKKDTTTSTISQKYPSLLNSTLHSFKDDYNTPLSYKLSVPLFQIFSVPINIYNLILVVFFFITSYFCNSQITLVIFTIFTVFNVIEYNACPSNIKEIITTSLLIAGVSIWGYSMKQLRI